MPQPPLRKLDFEAAADHLHDLICEADAETLATIYENAFGAVQTCEVSDDEHHLEVQFEEGLDNEGLEVVE